MFVVQIIVAWFIISIIFSLALGSFLSLTNTSDEQQSIAKENATVSSRDNLISA